MASESLPVTAEMRPNGKNNDEQDDFFSAVIDPTTPRSTLSVLEYPLFALSKRALGKYQEDFIDENGNGFRLLITPQEGSSRATMSDKALMSGVSPPSERA